MSKSADYAFEEAKKKPETKTNKQREERERKMPQRNCVRVQ